MLVRQPQDRRAGSLLLCFVMLSYSHKYAHTHRFEQEGETYLLGYEVVVHSCSLGPEWLLRTWLDPLIALGAMILSMVVVAKQGQQHGIRCIQLCGTIVCEMRDCVGAHAKHFEFVGTERLGVVSCVCV